MMPENRFWGGWVAFEGIGADPAAFLRMATATGVQLWNTRCEACRIRSCCRAAEYRRLRSSARRCGLRLRLRQKHGLPFRLRPLRHRYGIAAGGLLGAVLLTLLPHSLWIVSVEGNTTVPTETITQVVAALGVVPGARCEDLDIAAIRLQALPQLPGVAWLTVNPEGCIAHVEVTEQGNAVPPDDSSIPSDLVASCDGIILSVTATGGWATVRPGEAVTAGDRLISGTFETEQYIAYRRSKGSVIARTEHTLTAAVPLKESLWLPQGERVYQPVFQLLRWSIPLYTGRTLTGDYALTETDRRLQVRGLTLPLGIIGRTYTAYTAVTVTRTPATAKALAVRQLSERFRTAYPRASLLGRKTTAALANGVFRLTGVFTCQEDIARELPLVGVSEGGSVKKAENEH